MPTIQFSKPAQSGLSKADVQKLAENIASQVGYNPGDDIFDVLKKLGGRYRYLDLSKDTDSDSGSLYVHGEGNFEVVIATNTSVVRDRFTIAHEIGHYILHYIYNKRSGKQVLLPMSATRYGSDRIEWEANWFAASFLMPVDKFKESYARNNGDVEEVSKEFGVSFQAAKVRAESIYGKKG